MQAAVASDDAMKKLNELIAHLDSNTKIVDDLQEKIRREATTSLKGREETIQQREIAVYQLQDQLLKKEHILEDEKKKVLLNHTYNRTMRNGHYTKANCMNLNEKKFFTRISWKRKETDSIQ
jgi:hypothetical protein